METQIVPCRAEISDRFPVASFAVTVPPARCFEVACATDPRLFHTDWQRYRSPGNFYSSRQEGLMRAPGGHTAWFIPPEQLRRFAGAQRIYYALGTYETAYGGAPEFTIAPDGLERIPFIAMASDFTGRGLDRSRLGIAAPPPDAYGAVDASTLTWGGDQALAAYRAAEAAPSQDGGDYDDGYPKELWHEGDAVAGQAGVDDADGSHEAYGDDEHVAAAAGLEADGYDFETGEAEDTGGGAYAHAHSADGPSEETYEAYDDGSPDASYAHAAGENEYGEDEPPAEGYGAAAFHDDASDDADEDDGTYGGFADAAAIYGAGEAVEDEEPGGYRDAAEINASGAGYEAAAMADGDDEPPYEGDSGYGGAYDPTFGANGYDPAYGSVYGGYAPAEDDGGVAVAEPEPAEAQGAGAPAVLTGRDPGYSDEDPEESPLPVGHAATALAIVPLDIAEKVRILRVVAQAESGADGYAAINPDNEYNDPHHPAYHRYHIGLSWGFIQFTQRSGSLGRVLQAVRRREEALGAALPAEQRMEALFGPHWRTLLDVTSAADPEARVAEVGGKPLWDPEWTARFRAAGRVPHVTYAQNEIAITDYVDPTLRFAHWLGFDDARALAMLWDRCIHMGIGGGTSWIVRHCGPVRTEEERRAALAALGHADLRAFQQSQAPHLGTDGRWGPKTHAAMVAALRAIGTRSPVTIPARDALLQRMVDASAETGFNRRLSALHANRADFDDATTYTLV